MSIMYHPSNLPATRPRRRPLVGCATRHGNSAWTTSVRGLRAVLIAARPHAPRERVPSGDELAELVIDMAGELTARDRAVLAVMFGDLVRASRRDRGNDRRQLELFDRS
jgi:hypothetical protein